MKRIVRTLLDIYQNEFSEAKDVNGNYFLSDALHSDPTYMSSFEAYVKKNVTDIKRRGRHPNAPNDVSYILELIKVLYKDNNVDKINTVSTYICLKRCFEVVAEQDAHQEDYERVVSGAKEVIGDFFITPLKGGKKIHWINTFSALGKYCKIFGEGDFLEFLSKYSTLYSKMNNRAVEPFYSRSIKDICACYTVYTQHTSDFYYSMCASLASAKELGDKLSKKTGVVGSTGSIRDHFVYEIFEKYGRDENKVITELCNYIREHSGDFETERHYGVIQKALEICEKAREIDTDGFFSSDASPKEKDNRIAAFEYRLYNLLAEGLSDEERLMLDTVLLDSTPDCLVFPNPVAEEIVNGNVGKRNEAEAATNTAALLRYLIILSEIYGAEGRGEYSTSSLTDSINTALESVGMIGLQGHCNKYYTAGREMDWCITAYVDMEFGDGMDGEPQYEL